MYLDSALDSSNCFEAFNHNLASIDRIILEVKIKKKKEKFERQVLNFSQQFSLSLERKQLATRRDSEPDGNFVKSTDLNDLQ